FFLLSAALLPPAFPPFPPRRSSDLHLRRTALSIYAQHRLRAGGADEQPGVIRHDVLAAIAAHHLQHLLTADSVWRLFGELSGHRSEEHTSELQSRENLVCRLLLETK